MIRPTAFWLYDDSADAFVDYTNNIRKGTTITLSLTDVNDVWYIGFDRRFRGFLCDVSIAGNYSSLEFEYYNGSWSSLSIVTAYDFSISKYCDWVVSDDWSRLAASTTEVGGFPNSGATGPNPPATVPDSNNRFWLRIKLSAGGSQTSAAVISRFRVFPYATYTTPNLIQSFLQLPVDVRFDYDSNPNIFNVEELICQAENKMDQYLHKSWKFNHTLEYLDFNTYGNPVIYHHSLQRVYEVAIWDGSVYDILTEGRNNEYFVDYETGMIIYTRYFVLPIRAQIMRGYWRWDIGEYNRAVRVDYSYGQDLETSREFKAVQDIATKMVAIDLISNHPYGIMTVQGTDRATYSDRIRQWQEDIDKTLDRLSSVVIF